MKILAIRGKDLASIAGEFAIDFEAPPLDRANLFAITGPTGAGKSTLLDAVCLALFDRTPRLPGGGGALIGREDQPDRLRDCDVRHVLRQGATSAYAEVDFVGRDSRRYRARWEVRRAHLNLEGALQTQGMELRDLEAGEIVSNVRSRVREIVEQKLGLSFDQFRRSVLLAQGDFAAFLAANADERSKLLERMTGTELYSRLSAAAFERSRRERDALEALEGRLAAIALLRPEERTELERAVQERTSELSTLRAEIAAIEAGIAWWEVLEKLQGEEEAAAVAVRGADDAWEASAQDRRDLDRIRAAQPLRHLVSEFDRTSQQREEAAAELARRTEKAAEARNRRSAAIQEFTRCEGARADAEERRAVAQPELDAAAELDAKIEARKQEVERARAAAAGSGGVAKKFALGVDQLRRDITSSEETLARLNDWLRSHRTTGELAGRWSVCERDLERFEKIRSRVARIETEDREIGAELSLARSQHNAAEMKRAEAQGQLAVAIATAEEAGRAAECAGAANVGKQLREETRRLNRLEKVVEAGDRFGEAREAEKHAETLRSRAHERLEKAIAESTAAGKLKVALGSQLAEVERQLSRARLAEELETERAALRNGEPCALCGALEHPWADRPPRNTGATKKLEKELKSVRQRLDDAATSEAREHERAEGHKKTAEEQRAEAEKHRSRAAAALESWKKLVADFPEKNRPRDLPTPAELDRVKDLLKAAEETAERLDRSSKESVELAEAADAARRNVESVRQVASATEKALHDAALEIARLEGEARTRAEVLKRERALEHEALDSLEEPFCAVPDWRKRLITDPATFARARRAEIEEWTTKRAASEAAAVALVSLRERVAAAEASYERASERALADAALAATSDNALGSLTTDRQGLFGGRKTDEVRRELDSAVERARNAAQSADRLRGEEATAASAVEALEMAAREVAHSSDASFNHAQAALQAEISTRGLDLSALRECLCRDEAWIETRAEELEKLRRRCSDARIILEERARRRFEHEKTHSPNVPQAELAACRHERLARASAAESDLARLKREIDLDDLRRTERDALVPRVEFQRERCGLWKSLSDLIGSKDGKAFRKFAQSLTLDLLVDHANEHLKRLARRYRLERVPGYELDLQVIDRDLGDEVRTVKGLSGGEAFLVSLGLALGLASLAKADVPIESLFIDEGFGSLDPDTLDSALYVLDALHDGNRRIGLISHVPGLAERVGVQIRVTPRGAGTSTIEVASES